MGHQHSPQQVILPCGSFTKDFLVSQNTKAICAYILWELNIHAQILYQLEEKNI